MSIVFPGVDDVMAKPFRPVSILMSDDLPTFDRPMNAYSGVSSSGHFLTSELLITNFASLIIIGVFVFCKVSDYLSITAVCVAELAHF